MERKKYNVIYCDPPWHFQAYSPKGTEHSADRHYPTMGIELFARQKPEGWDVWGNEVECDVDLFDNG